MFTQAGRMGLVAAVVVGWLAGTATGGSEEAPAPATREARVPAPATRPWPAMKAVYVGRGASHLPLYFEDIGLERYGCSAGDLLQPAVSTLIQGGNTLLFPYNLWRLPPWKSVPAAAYPAEPPAPCLHREGVDLLAAVFEAGVIVGLVALVP